MSRTDRPAQPRWAQLLGGVCLGLVALAVLVGLTGGFRLRLFGSLLKVESPLRILVWTLGIVAIRQLALGRWQLHDEIREWFTRWQRTKSYGALIAADLQPTARCGAPRRRDTAFVMAVIALFTVLTLVITAPLLWHMHDAVHDPGDPFLNLWILDWIAWQLPRHPLHLFDGNIFWPEQWTLAYSETLLAPALLSTPMRWLGAGRVLTYNVVFLSGFVLSGAGAALLVRRLTGNVPAAIASGVVFAYLPFRFDHYPQLQLQQAQWIPLALWAYHRVLDNGRWRDAVVLGGCVAGQLLSCMYYGVYLVTYFAVAGTALWFASPIRDRARVKAIGIAIVVALVLFAPAANAYLQAHAVVGERGAGEVAARSATWQHYRAAPRNNLLLGWTAARYGAEERNLYPGAIAVALSAVALWPPVSAVRLAYAVGAAWGVTVTFGSNAPPYRALYRYVPPFRALRIPALAIVLVGLSVAVLAGFGLDRLSRRFAHRHAAAALSAACCIGVLAESWPAPMKLDPVAAVPPPIYATMVGDLGDSPPVPIVELPVILGGDQTYMYYATFHRQRLLNGYSGFFPPSYLQVVGATHRFPDERALRVLRERGARYALVHGEFLEPAEYDRTTHAADTCGCGLTLLGRQPWAGREISLYRIEY